MWLLTHLVAMYALFNASKDVIIQHTAPSTVCEAIATVPTQHLYRYIVCQNLHYRFGTGTQTFRQTSEFYPIYVIDDTNRCRIGVFNPKCRRSAKGQIITPRHHQYHFHLAACSFAEFFFKGGC